MLRGCLRGEAPEAAAVGAVVLGLLLQAAPAASAAQPSSPNEVELRDPPASAAPPRTAPPDTAGPPPETRDDEIRERLAGILAATGWFTAIDVAVEQGVVFLEGRASAERARRWAEELAGSTQDVTAVVNRLTVDERSPWELAPVFEELRHLWTQMLRALPRLFVALVVLALAWFAARGASRLGARLFRSRVASPLLREVIGRAMALLVLVLGFYFALQLIGLARLAATVIGGTGLIGLVLGIAFRDITENFLASIYLSVQRPFRAGDLVEVDGSLGYVQRLTTRTTVLMTLDGNHVQIPNATVFKSTLRNYTSNPKRREEFTVGIGYEESIAEAQRVALDVLTRHPAVLAVPEPSVLADSLGAATVNLRVYFWLDGREHSWLKLRSSLIRLVKRAFQQAGISMPDTAREIVFPRGVPVHTFGEEAAAPSPRPSTPPRAPEAEAEAVTTDAEAGLGSEAMQIERQARASRSPEEGAGTLVLEPSEEAAEDDRGRA